MRLVRAAEPEDAAAIAAIYDPLVRDGHASFEIDPPGPKEIARRLVSGSRTYPWLVMTEGSELVAYAYAGPHRARPGYRWSTETSIYVRSGWRRRGAGGELYLHLLDQCRDWGYVSAYAGIALPNPASERLHASIGFVPIGVFPRVGLKLGNWHDVSWWYLSLSDDPSPPVTSPGPPTIPEADR
ncbi:MAG: N-acetyltransferase family protein [Acidimicrobiia bacterium]